MFPICWADRCRSFSAPYPRASSTSGECCHTDRIGLCWAMLDRPVGTYGDNVQWAASGGHPSDRAKAPPLAPLAQSTMSFGFAGPQAHEIAKWPAPGLDDTRLS